MSQVSGWVKCGPIIHFNLFQAEYYNNSGLYQNCQLIRNFSIFKTGEVISLIYIDNGRYYNDIYLFSEKISPKMISLMLEDQDYFQYDGYIFKVIKHLGLNSLVFRKCLMYLDAYKYHLDQSESGEMLTKLVNEEQILREYILKLESNQSHLLYEIKKQTDSEEFCYQLFEFKIKNFELKRFKKLEPGFFRDLPRGHIRKLIFIENFIRDISNLTGISTMLNFHDLFGNYDPFEIHFELLRILQIRNENKTSINPEY